MALPCLVCFRVHSSPPRPRPFRPRSTPSPIASLQTRVPPPSMTRLAFSFFLESSFRVLFPLPSPSPPSRIACLSPNHLVRWYTNTVSTACFPLFVFTSNSFSSSTIGLASFPPSIPLSQLACRLRPVQIYERSIVVLIFFMPPLTLP